MQSTSNHYLISERPKETLQALLTFTREWGLSLAYSQTLNLDKSEKAIEDAIVSIAADTNSITSIKEKFASIILHYAKPSELKNFSATEDFFALDALTRAVVILNVKANFHRDVIAKILKISVSAVELHLDKSRATLFNGRTWLEKSSEIFVAEPQKELEWTPSCPYFKESKEEIQNLFTKYLNHELNSQVELSLQGHLMVCIICRDNLKFFKNKFQVWKDAQPSISSNVNLEKNLKNYFQQTIEKVQPIEPHFLSGFVSMFQNPLNRWIFFGILFSFIYLFRKF